jgi:hypothetical protein
VKYGRELAVEMHQLVGVGDRSAIHCRLSHFLSVEYETLNIGKSPWVESLPGRLRRTVS